MSGVVNDILSKKGVGPRLSETMMQWTYAEIRGSLLASLYIGPATLASNFTH